MAKLGKKVAICGKNNSISAITRLMEMGIEPYLISSSLLACLAQRLLRINCPECVIHYFASEGELKELGIDEDKKTRLFKGKGCSACFDSGFKGRTGIFELLKIDEDLRSLILQNQSLDTFQAHQVQGRCDDGSGDSQSGYITHRS